MWMMPMTVLLAFLNPPLNIWCYSITKGGYFLKVPFHSTQHKRIINTARWASTTTTTTTTSATSSQQQTLVTGTTFESEYEVKKSKFIGYAVHVLAWDDASSVLADIKSRHPKARHVCFGFRVGDGKDGSLNERCSDDGEPTGTAGVPILGAIQGEQLTNVLCVVVRYFGGIKLGAGGLIRAYAASARQVLREAAPYEIVIPTTSFSVTVPASYLGALYETISCTSSASSVGEGTYNMDGSLTLTVSCQVADVEYFRTILMDATRGQALFHS